MIMVTYVFVLLDGGERMRFFYAIVYLSLSLAFSHYTEEKERNGPESGTRRGYTTHTDIERHSTDTGLARQETGWGETSDSSLYNTH